MLSRLLSILVILSYTLFGIRLDISFPLKENLIESEEDTAFAILEIPDIFLIHELYSPNDKRSDINERLIFLNTTIPTDEKGNIIIAGHSGFGDIAYFKNLYKLKLGEKIFLTYQNKKYTYEIVNIYKVPKTGQVEIIRDSNKKVITLITCYGNSEQLIVIGEQKK